jgi:hypothetical protein
MSHTPTTHTPTTHTPHRTTRYGGRRVGLAGALLGIAALSGAGTVAGVLPAISTAHPRPVTVADAAVPGLPASSTTAAVSSRRDRTDASVPGAAPFPRTASSAITSIFT